MGIRPKFTKEDIKRRFDRLLAVIEKRQIERLQRLGEECVTHARLIPADRGFTDRTGNLRSSIGYVIFKDGRAIHENFQEVNGPEGGNAGKAIAAAKRVANDASKKHPTGLCLVVTAGMNYAVYVESKGRDVLTSAERMAAERLPKMVQEITQNVKKIWQQ